MQIISMINGKIDEDKDEAKLHMMFHFACLDK